LALVGSSRLKSIGLDGSRAGTVLVSFTGELFLSKRVTVNCFVSPAVRVNLTQVGSSLSVSLLFMMMMVFPSLLTTYVTCSLSSGTTPLFFMFVKHGTLGTDTVVEATVVSVTTVVSAVGKPVVVPIVVSPAPIVVVDPAVVASVDVPGTDDVVPSGATVVPDSGEVGVTVTVVETTGADVVPVTASVVVVTVVVGATVVDGASVTAESDFSKQAMTVMCKL